MGSKKTEFPRKRGLFRGGGGGRGVLRAGDTGPSALPACRALVLLALLPQVGETQARLWWLFALLFAGAGVKGGRRVMGKQRDEPGGPSAAQRGYRTQDERAGRSD